MAPMTKQYRIPLVMQWDGGLRQLINQQYGFVRGNVFVRAPIDSLKRERGVWKIAIGDIPGIEKGLVLPVSKEFRPVASGGEYALCLNDGNKLCFEKTLRVEDDWLRTQADAGNALYEIVSDDTWTLLPHQQNCLDGIECMRRKHARDRSDLEKKVCETEREMESLRSENESLRSEMENLRSENKSLKSKLSEKESENESFKSKLSEKESEIHSLKIELYKKEAELYKKDSELYKKDSELYKKDSELYKKDVENLQSEIVRLRAQVEEKNSEIVRLRAQVEEKDSEIVRLKAKIGEKDSEIVRYRSQVVVGIINQSFKF